MTLIDCRANLPPFEARWHIAQCQSGLDYIADRALRRRGYDIYRPLVPVPVKNRLNGMEISWRSMFSGYIFVRPAAQGWEMLRTAPGMLYGDRALMKQNNRLVSISDDDPAMEMVRETVQRLSTVETAEEPLFRVGDQVHIRKGPWMDFWGRIEKLDGSGRIGILLDMLGRKVRALVPEEHVFLAGQEPNAP